MRIWLLICAGFVGLVAGATGAAGAKPTLTVLAAISLRDAMADVERTFEAAHDVDVEFAYGASGQLAAQIEGGAPADVFIAAADAPVDRLVAAHRVDAATRRTVARNVLVLVVPAGAASPPASFAALADAGVRRVAVGEPKSVPAGTYAAEVFAHLKLGPAVAAKLVYGANVRQVLDYVARGEADAGVVYATDVIGAGDRVREVARADAAWHAPIRYPAVVVSGSKQAALATAFVAALGEPPAVEALRRQGFIVDDTEGATSRATTRPGGR